MTGLLFDIARGSYVDGPGVRTTFFMKGCNLRCRWCHNPEGQACSPEMMFFKGKCTGCGNCTAVCARQGKCELCGECVEVCPADARRIAGKRVTADEILAIAGRDIDYYDSTGGGVTFSGGECMLQAPFVAEAAAMLREKGISVAIDTAGDVDFSEFERVMPYADLFLYDIKCAGERKHIDFTGVSNKRILENFRRLAGHIPQKIIVRVPVIPGFNAAEAEMRGIRRITEPFGIVPELLPYHAMGLGKAEAIGQEQEEFRTPTREEMEALREVFARSASRA